MKKIKTPSSLDAGRTVEKNISNMIISNLEADTLLREARTKQTDEHHRMFVTKRRVGVSVTCLAVIVHGMMMWAGHQLLADPGQETWVKIAVISASVVSFMAIYGIILRSTLASPPPHQQQDGDSPYISAKDILKAARKISEDNSGQENCAKGKSPPF